MSTTSILSLVLAGVSALQAILATLSGRWFDSIWHRFLSTYIERNDKENTLGMREFFNGSEGFGPMRADVLIRLMRVASGVVAALATLLAVVAAGTAAFIAAFAADRDNVAWVAGILTIMSIVAFFVLLVFAVQGQVYDYRDAARRDEPGLRGLINRWHPTTLRFHQITSLVLSCLLILISTVLTLNEGNN